MKRAVVGALALFFFTVSPASAITVDGHLGDWGVNPFYDWTPEGTNMAYTVHDNITGDKVANGLGMVKIPLTEDWDVEAMYAQITESTLNFAIVTSRDQTSSMGDLAISLYKGTETETNADKKYEFGVDITGFGASDNVVNRGVYAVTDWDTNHAGSEYNFPLAIVSGTKLGDAQVIQRYAGAIEPGKYGIFAKTYILEGIIDLDLLGISEICELNFELAFAKVSCIRDYAVVKGGCDGPCEVPEPSSLFLLGSALLGFGGLRRRKA